MNEKKKKQVTARLQCGKEFGTAFLISPTRALTAYHAIMDHVEEKSPIFLDFPFLKDGKREAILINARETLEEDVDIAILEFENPVEEVDPLILISRDLNKDYPWEAFGFPITKTKTGDFFVGDFSHNVIQHISQYDLDLKCSTPDITDQKYIVKGASGSAVIVKDEVVALLSYKMAGGTIGAVSIRSARNLLTKNGVPFIDKSSPELGFPSTELANMFHNYSLKIEHFLDNVDLPFSTTLDKDLIIKSGVNHFFEQPSWKLNIKRHIRVMSREFATQKRDREIVEKLQGILELQLPYDELRTSMLKSVNTILAELPDDRSTNDLRPLLYELHALLNKSFCKLLLISGESGTGKTHFLSTILSLHKIEKHLEEFSIRIPLSIAEMKEKDFKDVVIDSVNRYFNSEFSNINVLDEFIIAQELNISIVFVIDGLQSLLYSSSKYYKDLKKIVVEYTRFDWISWCVSINENDQYLLLDNSDFMRDYCFSKSNEVDALNLFVSMTEINTSNKVCQRILLLHNIDVSVIEQFPSNQSNIAMLLDNPLLCHVYANTVKDIKDELPNLCYFDFIKRYSDIKKRQMIMCSERDLPEEEIDANNSEEIKHVVNKLMVIKKLTIRESESNDIFSGIGHCYFELRFVQLLSKEIVEIPDFFESTKVINVKFSFKLYWAYRILLQYYRDFKDWANFYLWRNKFSELKSELLMYEILFLDTSFDEHKNILLNEIKNVLSNNDEKELLFNVSLKTSFDCQKLLFAELFQKEKMDLNKQETFGLMYFMMHSKAIHTFERSIILSKYIDLIAEYGLDIYYESCLKRILSHVKNLTKLKRSLKEFVNQTAGSLNKITGRVFAENFIRIVINEEEYRKLDLEEIINNHLINFLSQNSQEIENSKLNKNDVVDYFLRSLFRLLIEKENENKFQLHEIMLENNYYYLDGDNQKFKTIAHILRGSVAIAYGNVYKYLDHSRKKNFKEQYISYTSSLINTGIRNKLLTFHFISNTLIDQDAENELVDSDFIPLLVDIYEDEKLKKFTSDRKNFFERNINRHY